jgi:hypothetical protein
VLFAVNDGSKDQTAAILAALSRKTGTTVASKGAWQLEQRVCASLNHMFKKV